MIFQLIIFYDWFWARTDHIRFDGLQLIDVDLILGRYDQAFYSINDLQFGLDSIMQEHFACVSIEMRIRGS